MFRFAVLGLLVALVGCSESEQDLFLLAFSPNTITLVPNQSEDIKVRLNAIPQQEDVNVDITIQSGFEGNVEVVPSALVFEMPTDIKSGAKEANVKVTAKAPTNGTPVQIRFKLRERPQAREQIFSITVEQN